MHLKGVAGVSARLEASVHLRVVVRLDGLLLTPTVGRLFKSVCFVKNFWGLTH